MERIGPSRRASAVRGSPILDADGRRYRPCDPNAPGAAARARTAAMHGGDAYDVYLPRELRFGAARTGAWYPAPGQTVALTTGPARCMLVAPGTGYTRTTVTWCVLAPAAGDDTQRDI